MTCDDCIHKPVCYRTDGVSPSYANKCGDFASEVIGHWIDEFGGCTCSECGCLEAGYSNYCPSCGAKMVEVEE